MRTKKSIINMIVGVGGQLLTLLLTFLGRLIFVHYLSAAHLGVNGLFTNLISVMSLAEMGMGTAMAYAMYKPAAEQDHDMMVRLLNLYRRLYRIVAAVVFAFGMALYPFLNYFIKDAGDVEHLHFIYLMYLANAVASYLYSYKSSVLIVNQREYIKNLYENLAQIARIAAQILILVLTGNFILYLAVQLFSTFMANVLIARKVDRDYPYLNAHKELPPDNVRKSIAKNIYAMSMHKFGTVIVLKTDSLIMSAFVGLTSVGIYSNYKLVTSNANTLLNKIYSAFTGSIGHLSATESADKIYEIYQALDFLLFLLYGYVTAAVYVLANPFVELFFGKAYLFPMLTVFFIAADFYVTGMRQINLKFKETLGIFWQDRFKPLAESVINLVVSIALVGKYQVAGVMLGTIVSSMLTNFWVEPYMLMRYGIKEAWQPKLRRYFVDYILRTAVMVIGTAAAWYACRPFACTNFALLVLRGIVCTAVYCLVVVAFFGRSWQFKYLKNRVLVILRHRREAKKEKA